MFGLVLQLSIRIKKNYDHLLDNLNSNFNNFYIILKPQIFHPPYFTSLGGGGHLLTSCDFGARYLTVS